MLKLSLEASVGLCNFSLPSALILCQLAFTLFLPKFEVYFPHSIFEGHFDGTMVPSWYYHGVLHSMTTNHLMDVTGHDHDSEDGFGDDDGGDDCNHDRFDHLCITAIATC